MPLTEFHVPDYFVDGHRVQNVRIDPDKVYVRLDQVAERLFPGATANRPIIQEYGQSLEEMGRVTPAVEEAIEKASRIRSETTAIVYVAGPLTGVSEELKARYGMASALLSEYPPSRSDKPQSFFGYVPHLHGTDPVKHPDVSPDEVRDIDFLWAKITADYHVNFLDPTAHGNAIELGWAESSMIPSVNMNPEGNRLSRLTLGMNNVFSLIKYEEFEQDGLRSLQIDFDEIQAWLNAFPNRDPREFYYMGYRALGNALLRVAESPFVEELGDQYEHNIPLGWLMDLSKMKAYMRNPSHPNYGEAGQIQNYGWSEGDSMTVLFPNGLVDRIEASSLPTDVSIWRN